MPGMDGLELLEVIREDKNLDIPFIIFTGKGREEVAMKALNLGADRYLQKRGDPKSQFRILSDAVIQETERKKVQEKKKELEAEFISLVEGSKNPICILDKNFRIIFANQAELNRAGKHLKKLKEKNSQQSILKKTLKQLNKVWKKFLKQENLKDK